MTLVFSVSFDVVIEAIKMRIMNRRVIFSIVVMHTAWGATASAQSLAECIATAREHNIGMLVADLQVQRARRMEGSYFEMERTELSLSQDPTSGGSPDNALTLSQRFDFPTVYGSRRKMLKAETEVETSRRRLTESELTRDVSSAYSTLLCWQHIDALLCQNDSVLGEFVRTADVRFRNGETNRLELMNAQRMKAENTMQQQEAQNERAAAVLRIHPIKNSPCQRRNSQNGTTSCQNIEKSRGDCIKFAKIIVPLHPINVYYRKEHHYGNSNQSHSDALRRDGKVV